MPTGLPTDVSWLLTRLVERVPHARGACLLSVDGLLRAAHGLQADTAEHLAAVASGLHALAGAAGRRLPDCGAARQVAVELENALLFVSATGQGACLAVLAGRETDAALLGHEMTLLIRSVRPVLAAPPRRCAERWDA
ncbi:roadblock/LC7 domain-containing protein [Streptomyces specialis]|uniref:roadblock/LC7 domain-containing protein n=1 Tax=Streptomyces specialis TaxID=498367 RepID=UPI00073EF308|nr:roadblock/LC7 domain-containing protein [Streptomyces specialis]